MILKFTVGGNGSKNISHLLSLSLPHLLSLSLFLSLSPSLPLPLSVYLSPSLPLSPPRHLPLPPSFHPFYFFSYILLSWNYCCRGKPFGHDVDLLLSHSDHEVTDILLDTLVDYLRREVVNKYIFFSNFNLLNQLFDIRMLLLMSKCSPQEVRKNAVGM